MSSKQSLLEGFIRVEHPTVTHQSALRIVMSTSYDKFLDARYSKHWNAVNSVTLNKQSIKKLLYDWQRKLRPTASASKELNALKGVFMSHFEKKAMKLEEPLDGTFELVTVITFPWLKGHGKRLRERAKAIRKNTKPDTDNLIKVFKDCMEKSGCIINDSRIARDIIEKRHGEDYGVQYCLREIDVEIPRTKPVVEDRPF